MNERIKELIKQATTVEEHKWGVSYDNFNKEKFAELIVRECSGFRNELGIALCNDPSALHRYFGVEE
jgi:hypothetical protein